MPAPIATWEYVSGSELLEALNENRLQDILQQRSAIYIWKKALQNPGQVLTDSRSLVGWIDHLLDTPHSIVNDKYVGPHIQFRTIELKSQPATQRVRNIIQHWTTKRSNRHWLNAYLASLTQHTPALYVGETGNLQRRIAEHLRAQTDFGILVDNHLSWNSIDLHYCILGVQGKEDNQLRKAIEYITNSLTYAGHTKRPG